MQLYLVVQSLEHNDQLFRGQPNAVTSASFKKEGRGGGRWAAFPNKGGMA